MEQKKPFKTKDMIWAKTGEVYILTDKDTNKNYSIDPISFLVWIQCDGKTEVDKIADTFAVDGNRDIVEAAIKGILEKLEKNGLIRWE